MSLTNYKHKYAALKEKTIQLEKEFAELCEKHDKVVLDKK